jgi:hypothetical protein
MFGRRGWNQEAGFESVGLSVWGHVRGSRAWVTFFGVDGTCGHVERRVTGSEGQRVRVRVRVQRVRMSGSQGQGQQRVECTVTRNARGRGAHVT